MGAHDIISSGLLELYAAGIASEQEAMEVETALAQYPEVAAELRAISSSMESYVNLFSIAPSPHVKNKILARIHVDDGSGHITPDIVGSSAKAKVIDINAFWKIAAAVSLLLLIGSVALNVITYNRYSVADRRLKSARQAVADLEARNKVMEEGMNVVQSKYSVPVSLKGQDPAPGAAAKVFWMENTGEVFIDPSNLPEAPEGKQYQLWGIVDGKPVDAGMILTSKQGDKYRIQKMKTFGRVEAFAVSLEAEQGNQSPKGPVYVMGKM